MFKTGDKVVLVKIADNWKFVYQQSLEFMKIGNIYEVVENDGLNFFTEDTVEVGFFYDEADWLDCFKKILTPVFDPSVEFHPPVYMEPLKFNLQQSEPLQLGVHRPNLEDRKKQKVPMHMVIDGFPHALEHVAEIMAWARDVKGYKLHDWVNLPNAEIEFPSAQYRHQGDNSKQKAKGLTALERVDHESAKLHIGHQVFNLLAELELVLRGKIK